MEEPLGHSHSCRRSPGRSWDRQLGLWSKGRWGKARAGSRAHAEQRTGYRSCGDKSGEDRQGRGGRSRYRGGQGDWGRRGKQLHERGRQCRSRWEEGS